MKKIFIVCLIILFTISWANLAYCGGPMRKLERGLCNSLTFPFELYYQMQKTSDREGIGRAVTYGLLKGLGMMFYRAGAGLYEVITFPFPAPKEYEPILKEPEFFVGSPD